LTEQIVGVSDVTSSKCPKLKSPELFPEAYKIEPANKYDVPLAIESDAGESNVELVLVVVE
jgi:hypothetical protein